MMSVGPRHRFTATTVAVVAAIVVAGVLVAGQQGASAVPARRRRGTR